MSGTKFEITDFGVDMAECRRTPMFKITKNGLDFCGFQSNVLLRVVRDLDPGGGMTPAEVLLGVEQPQFAETDSATQGWYENLMDPDEKFSHVEGMLEEYAQKGYLCVVGIVGVPA